MKNWNPFILYKFEFDNSGDFASCYVPKRVARCPICKGRLDITATGWIEENKHVFPDEITLTCENENSEKCPDNAIEWQMPYVYWLPVQTTCQNWLNKMMRVWYGIRPIPQRWLERNGQLKLPFRLELD